MPGPVLGSEPPGQVLAYAWHTPQTLDSLMNRPLVCTCRISFIFIAAAIATLSVATAAQLRSPDGRLVTSIRLSDTDSQAAACLTYSVAWSDQIIVKTSRLGLDIDGLTLTEGVRIANLEQSSHDQSWKPVCGERSTIRDHYNQLTVTLISREAPHRSVVVTFRAYNEGIAFCYTIPEQTGFDSLRIARERSEFRFTADHRTWVAYRAQADYQLARLSDVRKGCERPLTMQTADDLYLAIGEARLVDFARMKLTPLEGVPDALVSHLDGPVNVSLPMTTPWRVIMAARSPGRLLENNSIFLNLNDPCAIQDTSWIKPGKVIREVTLTTSGGKACVDFAATHGLQFVHFDAGWYGHEYDETSDATTISVDPKRSKGPLDLHQVIEHARRRGVDVIVYVNRRALEKQLDEILPLYKSWGIAGVKFGFVNVGSQKWTEWLHDAIRKAAEHRLMVNVHDEYRPTGYERTYPNLMTAEGIAGDETSPVNSNTLTILFTRMLCGPADNTICYYDPRVEKNATHAYQLAKAVCIYSPWQYLYWYDRPSSAPRRQGGAGGSRGIIGNEPELEFFGVLPTTWDETRVIDAEVGKYAMMARRSGSDWFVGAMNSGRPRSLTLTLDFLSPGQGYTAYTYRDDPSVNTYTKVRMDRRSVNSATSLKVTMSAQGGQAIRITPDDP